MECQAAGTLFRYQARQDSTHVLWPTSRRPTIHTAQCLRERGTRKRKNRSQVSFADCCPQKQQDDRPPSLRANAWHRACLPPATRCATSAEQVPRARAAKAVGASTSACLWPICFVCWRLLMRYFLFRGWLGPTVKRRDVCS